MGSVGMVIGRGQLGSASNPVQHLPITETMREWEVRTQREARQGVGQGEVETGALFDRNGRPIDAYLGTRHSVAIDPTKVNVPETEGATFTHLHPDSGFGGSLSLTDLKTFSRTNWGELRATTKQGQLYSIKAGQNADREGLRKWVNSNQRILNRNFRNSYYSSLKRATTVLKSGPHKGQVKLISPTGKVTYRAPMNAEQADRYARQYSVGMFERTYKKNLAKYGFTYTSTKGGRNR